MHPDFEVRVPSNNTHVFHAWLNGNHDNGFITNAFSLVRKPEQFKNLSEGSMKIQSDPNAGGSSVWSEVMSFEVLHRLFNCKLKCTEMELQYFPNGSKITDYSVFVNGHNIGVSVTRAMQFKHEFTLSDAERLLEKKLDGCIRSTRSVLRHMRWEKQILHVWVENESIMRLVNDAYQKMSPNLTADTLVICTLANDDCHFLFKNLC